MSDIHEKIDIIMNVLKKEDFKTQFPFIEHIVPVRTLTNLNDIFIAYTVKDATCTMPIKSIVLPSGEEITIRLWEKDIQLYEKEASWDGVSKTKMNHLQNALSCNIALNIMNLYNVSAITGTVIKDNNVVVLIYLKMVGLLILHDTELPDNIMGIPVVTQQKDFTFS